MKILKRLMVLFLSTGLVLNASLPSIAEVDHSTPMLWTVMESGTTEHLNGIWGSASNHIFAVGDNGTILYYDGTSWSTVASPVSGDINAIWGRSASEIYAVGDSGILIEFNGVEWDTSGAIPHPTGIVSDVFGSSTETFCALYGTLDGSPGGGAVMKRYPNWECRESELFCEIDDRPCNDARTNDRLNTIYVQESTDYVYVGGYRYISDRPVVGVRRNSTDGFENVSREFDDYQCILDIWGVGNTIFFSGVDYTAGQNDHYGVVIIETNGVKERKNLYGYGDVHDAWGFAADNVFFVTNDGQALHYNGSPVWVDSITGIDNPLNGVWGVNDESVFAVGADGIIIHYDVNNQKSSITLINGV